MTESAPTRLLLLLAKDETSLLDTTIWLDVRFDALDNMVLLEFKMLPVSLRAFETSSSILSFKLLVKSFVISSIELISTAKTFPKDGIVIDNTTSINIMPCKIAIKIATRIVFSFNISLSRYLDN
jgi:hypothetical protein